MGNSTSNADKKNLLKQDKMIKQRRLNMLEQKGKGNTRKNNNTTGENKPESTGERRKIKEISTIQTIQDIPKQRKKSTSTTGRFQENIPTTGFKRNRTILD